MNLSALGRHILIEYYNCEKEKLNDTNLVEKLMNEAAHRSGATIVESVFHTFNPYGVSGAVIISESHLTIHTWPEYGYASVDIYTCGDTVNPWLGFKYLEDELGATHSESIEIPRGMTDKIQKYAQEPFEVIQFKPVATL